MKNKKAPWNHNYAYHRWISSTVGKRNRILDVGCGDGTLALYLRTPDNDILGIDISDSSIQKAIGKMYTIMLRSCRQLLKVFRQTAKRLMQSSLLRLFIT